MTLTLNERRDLLTKIDKLVWEKFYDMTFKGHDWRALVATHRDRILAAAHCEGFETEINSLLRELGSAGLGLLSPATKIAPKNAIAATFHRVETDDGLHWAFQDVHAGGPAAVSGIRSGDILLSIDGREIKPPDKPAFAMDKIHELLIDSHKGHSTVTLVTPKAKYAENPCASPDHVLAEVRDGVAIVKIPLFQGKLGIDFAKQVSRVFDTQLGNVERLVLDLRGNPGGGAGCLRVMSLLVPDKRPIGFSIDRATAERGFDRYNLPRFDRIPSSRLEVPGLALRFFGKKSVVMVTEGLGPRPFHARIVVLVNEHTTCASEMVALFAREEAGAQIVGAATPGRLVTHTGFKLGHGFTLALPVAAYQSWSGKRLDGTGLLPDVDSVWSYQSTWPTGDSQLEAGLAAAKSTTSASIS